jgi:hypothetical protein
MQFSVINAACDSRMKEIVSVAGNLLTDLQKSPYRTRILAVLDKTHAHDVVETLLRAGIPEENVIVWDQNGVEYYYPTEALDAIFGRGGNIEIVDDVVSRNGVTYKKWELCEKVLSRLAATSTFPKEFSGKRLASIERVTC